MANRPLGISILGLGKLGCPMAALFGSTGFITTGVDSDSLKVEAINRSIAPNYEPGLQNLIDASKGFLSATTDVTHAVQSSDITCVVVPTPSQTDGAFSSEHVLSACKSIWLGLKKKSGFHVVVISSTVTPGTVTEEVIPAVEKASSK